MRERTVMRGMARLFWRDFCGLATPSTLWESGHFYFAPTGQFSIAPFMLIYDMITSFITDSALGSMGGKPGAVPKVSSPSGEQCAEHTFAAFCLPERIPILSAACRLS